MEVRASQVRSPTEYVKYCIDRPTDQQLLSDKDRYMGALLAVDGRVELEDLSHTPGSRLFRHRT